MIQKQNRIIFTNLALLASAGSSWSLKMPLSYYLTHSQASLKNGIKLSLCFSLAVWYRTRYLPSLCSGSTFNCVPRRIRYFSFFPTNPIGPDWRRRRRSSLQRNQASMKCVWSWAFCSRLLTNERTDIVYSTIKVDRATPLSLSLWDEIHWY